MGIVKKDWRTIMKKTNITFDVDHQKMDAGIYLANIQELGNVKTVTIDLRIKKPYADKTLTEVEAHTFEHCFATAIREHMVDMEDILPAYIGPMGCMTGFYLVFQMEKDTYGEQEIFEKIIDIIDNSVKAIDKMPEVPAKNKIACGNFYTLSDMDCAKKVADEIAVICDKCKVRGSFDQYVMS